MKTRSLIVLAVVAVVVAVVAVFAVQDRESGTRHRVVGERLFPGLIERVNSVASMEVTQGEDRYTIVRDGDVWGLAEKGGYPAQFDMVKKTILGIAEVALVEAKTSKRDRLGELYLAEPDAEEGPGTRIALRGEDGAELAAMILGKAARGGGGRRYVRRAGEDQAWLAEVAVDIGAKPMDWVDKTMTKLRPDRLRRVSISHGDGDDVVLEKADKENSNFTVPVLPEGAKVKAAMEINGIVSALSFLNIEDVAPATDIAFEGDELVTTRYETFDGLVITLISVTVGDVVWARFEAAYDAALADPVEEAPVEEEAEDGVELPPGMEEIKPLTAEDVQAEAEALGTRTAGWAFALPNFRADHLRKKLTAMIEYPDAEPEFADEIVPDASGTITLPPNITIEDLLAGEKPDAARE